MSDPLLNYLFDDGFAQNPDGSLSAVVKNCSHSEIDVELPGWGKLTDALSFSAEGSSIDVPAAPLSALKTFTIEAAIQPEKTADRLNIFEAQATPFALFLTTERGNLRLNGSVQLKQKGWQTLTASDVPIALGGWTSVGMSFTGDELVLFVNGEVIARRLFQAAQLEPVNGEEVYVGTWIDAAKFQFVGRMAGVRVWKGIADHVRDGVTAAAAQGMGEIESKWWSLGGPQGFLGQPTSPEGNTGAGRMRAFEGGHIYWTRRTGAHEIHGSILQKYKQHNGALGILGFPTSDELVGANNNIRVSRFELGHIYWSAQTGAFEVHGEILRQYLRLGGDASWLGLPLTDEHGVPGGRRSNFQNASIYWSGASGAHEIHGAIRERYDHLGGSGSFLGFPISDELDVTKAGKSIGKQSRFLGGVIYWSARTGAFEVHGDILKNYERLGGPAGSLGFPVTNETPVGGSDIRYSLFEQGLLLWRPSVGTRLLTEVEFRLSALKTGEVDDGYNVGIPPSKDRTAEAYSYVTIQANGKDLLKSRRFPGGSGHSGTGLNYGSAATFRIPIRPETKIRLAVEVWDYDSASGNDKLGSLDKTLDILTVWGLDNGAQGVFANHPATHRTGDAPRTDSLRFDFSVAVPYVDEPEKAFREKYWWKEKNFETPTLSRRQYVDTFRDVEVATNTYEKFVNLFDTLFYDFAYEEVADKGNCFGMSLEALHALKRHSVYQQPVFQYNFDANLKDAFNVKHGWQLGSDHIRWAISKLTSTEAFRPTQVLARIQWQLAHGDTPIVSMFNLDGFSGHSVLAYETGVVGGTPCIYVADPNLPYPKNSDKAASRIEIFPDDTFKFFQAGEVKYESSRIVGGYLPGTVMYETPYHVVCSQPRTPLWEIMLALSSLLGGLIVLAGDGVTEQISERSGAAGSGIARGASGTSDARLNLLRRTASIALKDTNTFYQVKNEKRMVKVNAIRGMARIPLSDRIERGLLGRLNVEKITGISPGVMEGLIEILPQMIGSSGPEIYGQEGRPSSNLEFTVRGVKKGDYHHFVRTATNAVHVATPAAANEVESMQYTKLDTSRPALQITSTAPGKTLDVEYGVIRDDHGRDTRRAKLSQLPVGGDTVALVAADPHSNDFIVSPGGEVDKPIKIEVEQMIDGKLATKQVEVRPEDIDDVIHVTVPEVASGPLVTNIIHDADFRIVLDRIVGRDQ